MSASTKGKRITVKVPKRLKRTQPKQSDPKSTLLLKAAKSSAPEEPLEGLSNLRTIHRDQAKQRMLAALSKHVGVIMYAAREAGISRKAHYDWMNNDADYREAVEDVNEGVGDFVERKILENIQRGQPAVQIFFAKTKLKHRGYQERHEITGLDGGSIDMIGNLTIKQTQQELPPAAIEEIIRKVTGGGSKAEHALRRLSGK